MATTADHAKSDDAFDGAKVALFIGSRLIVMRRDNRPDIPFFDMWDFPGGGREGDETPFQTVARETMEEVGLHLPPDAISWQRAFRRTGDGLRLWFFVAHLPAVAEAEVIFGDEGQFWRLADPDEVLTWPDVAGDLQQRLALWRAGGPACDAALAGLRV
ncbi:NUDIX domain-containing protein [Loktanella sp. DJP18]|uniref:NUDIX domain-containing protein n=1 Tax=Loktanella sp. DJP18 TaxID=3409788 RepID=UPI003BB77BFE